MIRNPLSQSEPSRRVVFISTAAALTTYIGYAQYSSSKYAVRGLAESMRNELKVYDIQTSIYYPGNINTDMYHSELRTKPREAQLIDSISSLCSVESAAQSLVDGIAKGRFAITNEASIWCLRVISNGVLPRSNTPFEMLVFPLYLLAGYIFRLGGDLVVAWSARQKKKQSWYTSAAV